MKDGIDHRAFAAELRSLDPAARRLRQAEFGRWLRAASRAAGWQATAGVLLVCAAPVLAFLGFRLRPGGYFLVPVALACLTVGSWFTLYSARRARVWRRGNPFEQWRAAR